MTRLLTIGQAARATGVTAKTIRYYEQVGILPAPRRTAAGYRQYDQPALERLHLIQRARALRLPLPRLRTLTSTLNGAGARSGVRPGLLALVREHLAEVERQLAELEWLRQQLEQVSRRMLTAPRRRRAGPCRCLDGDNGTVPARS